MPQKSAVPLFSNPSPELHSAQPSKKKKKGLRALMPSGDDRMSAGDYLMKAFEVQS